MIPFLCAIFRASKWVLLQTIFFLEDPDQYTKALSPFFFLPKTIHVQLQAQRFFSHQLGPALLREDMRDHGRCKSRSRTILSSHSNGIAIWTPFRSGNNDEGGEIMNVRGRQADCLYIADFVACLEGCRCYIGKRVPNNSINALFKASMYLKYSYRRTIRRTRRWVYVVSTYPPRTPVPPP